MKSRITYTLFFKERHFSMTAFNDTSNGGQSQANNALFSSFFLLFPSGIFSKSREL
jgi:hypothetical protein